MHVIVLVGVMADVLAGAAIGVLTMSSRSGTGRCDTYCRLVNVVVSVVADVHTFHDIDPGELVNIMFLLAFEWTQAAPQSVCWKDVAS